MITSNVMDNIFKIASKKGADFADIYEEKKQFTSIVYEDNKIEYISSGIEKGVGIRLINGEETLYGSSNDILPNDLKALTEKLSFSFKGKKKRANKSNLNVFTYEHLENENALLPNVEKDPSVISIDEKVKLVNLSNEAARSVDERIKQVKISYIDTIKDVIIYNSLGLYNCEKRIYTTFIISVVACQGGIIQTSSECIGGLLGFELFDKYNVEDLSRIAGQRAVNLLNAPQAPVGTMPVILSSHAGGTMIHEAIGHSLEADLVQKGVSPAYVGKKGMKIGSELITVIDDSTLFSKRGSYTFDDEGTPSEKTVLVKNGILKNYMYDLFTAWKDDTKSTGNGRRESFRHKPIPRMSNTYIAPGKDDPNEIIRKQDKGIFIKKMGGGQVNTATGDFVFEVEEAYLIVDSKIGPLIRGVTLIGNGPEILNSIDKVGNDLGFNIGTCGKDGQGVPVSDGQPTLRIPKIIIGGTIKE